MLSDLFGLTAAEAAVAHAVAAMPGRGLNGIAARLNIAETTLKTHLARVFLKTGAAGQADLVRMLAGLAVS
nr:LuxR C-terminal-related transcriptional regulator [Roseococcus sp. MDT2-1-1]